MDLLTTLMTATAGASATFVAVRARSGRARRAALARRLGELDVELPLDVDHLSPALAGLARGARIVRRLLETPLYRYDDALGHDTPWRLRERLWEYDLALADARLALWQWLIGVSRLEALDIAVLRQLQLDPRPLRSLMYAPGVFERSADVFDASIFPARPDRARVEAALCEAMDELRRFEVALLSHRPMPYR